MPRRGSEDLIEEEDLGVIKFDDVEEQKPNGMGRSKSEEIEWDVGVYGAKIILCKGCDRKFYENMDRDILFYVFDCWHIFCLPCVNKRVQTDFVNNGGSLKCLDPKCNNMIADEQIKSLVGQEKFEKMQAQAIQKMYNIITCCKCSAQFEFQEGSAKDAPKKDENGKPLTHEHAQDYAMNRFVCTSAACKTEQCRSCGATPYHLGMTCKQFKDRALMKYLFCHSGNAATATNP